MFDYGPWLLPPRGALRVRGDGELGARGVLPFRVSLLRGALPLPRGVLPYVRDARLPYPTYRDLAKPPGQRIARLH